MIHFLRRIRKKLLSENKFSKYILYAIGEIVLVVIGILIALQINNWNEERKTEKIASTYVGKIIGDLDRDLKNIDSLVALAKSNRTVANGYFNYYKNQENPEVETLLDTIQQLILAKYRYTPVNFTFKDMLSSGNSNLLDENQRAALIDLANSQDFFLIVFEKNIDEIIRSEREVNAYFEIWSTSNGIDFYDKLGAQQPLEDKIEGLLHGHNVLSGYLTLGRGTFWLEEVISAKTQLALKTLKKPPSK